MRKFKERDIEQKATAFDAEDLNIKIVTLYLADCIDSEQGKCGDSDSKPDEFIRPFGMFGSDFATSF